MCILAFISREVEEGAGLLESILIRADCFWVVILGSGCVEICSRLACWERGVQCVGGFAGREEFNVRVAGAGT